MKNKVQILRPGDVPPVTYHDVTELDVSTWTFTSVKFRNSRGHEVLVRLGQNDTLIITDAEDKT